MTPSLRRVLGHWPYLFVGLAFVLSRWAYRNVLGVEFDSTPVSLFIQYLDPWFIEHDFARSLLYLHHQAPLQNVLVGGAIRVLGQPRAFLALEALYTGLSFCTVLALLRVSLRLGANAAIASALCALYAVSPTTVVFENWLFYHVPVSLGLVLSLAALVHYQRTRAPSAALAFFSSIALVALFRSTFGPLFLAAALGLLLLRVPLGEGRRAARKILLRAAAVPFAVLLLNSGKPWLLTGHGYGETFLWGNLVGKMKNELPSAEITRLVERGAISRAATIFCLTDLREFAELRIPHAPTGVPLLDMERAPSGHWNAHALEYLLLTDKYYKPDAIYLVSHYPGFYLRSVGHALRDYAGSSVDDSMLPATPNYERLRGPREFADRALGQREDKSLPLLLFGLPLLAAYGAFRLLRARARCPSQHCSVTAIAYLLMTVSYVAGVSVLISCGDFGRYRFEADPLHLLLLSLLISDVGRVVGSFMTRAARTVGALRASRVLGAA